MDDVTIPTVEYYGTFNANGTCKAFYASDIHTPDQIPKDAVKLTQEQWQDWVTNQTDRRYDKLTGKTRDAKGVLITLNGGQLLNAKLR